MIIGCCCTNECPAEPDVDKWVNSTKVRPQGDSGGTHYTVPPFPRYDPGSYAADNSPDDCGDIAPGSCGDWLIGGDLLGVSNREIEEIVDDIMACAAPDVDHVSLDHNCYTQLGTKPLYVAKKRGAKWVLARKNWHGRFGWNNNDVCAQDPNVAASQTKYLTMEVTVADGSTTPCSDTPFDFGFSFSQTMTVGRKTGVKYQVAGDSSNLGGNVETLMNIANNTCVGDSFNGFSGSYDPAFYTIVTTATTGSATLISTGNLVEEYKWDVAAGSFFRKIYGFISAGCTHEDPPTFGVLIGETLDVTDTTLNYVKVTKGQNGFDVEFTHTESCSAGLSDPYTAADCYDDWLEAMRTWSLGDNNTYPYRIDEELANGPLIVYDELQGPTEPLVSLVTTMNDYYTGLADDADGNHPGDPGYSTTWAQIGWKDDRDYVWLFPTSGGDTYQMPGGFTGGATLLTPMWNGEIVSHTPAGYERHFWMRAVTMEREFDDDAAQYEWFPYTNGAFSLYPLPECSMRWMDNLSAQYDGVAYFGEGVPAPHGNYPQAWLHQKGGVLLGAKYVEAAEKWPALNFGRPCGPDKFSADQKTICCILSCDVEAGTFTVKKTGNATNPLDTGGIAVDDIIISTGCNPGVFPVAAITDDGTITDGDGNSWHQFTIDIGDKIDDLPTGYNIGGIVSDDIGDDSGPSDVLGRLRFWDAPGICGREAVTPSFADGTVTLTTAALPYLRTGESVDVCAADMTVLDTVTVTRVSDTVFTFTHAAMPTAAYITADGNGGADGDWAWDNEESQRTFVGLEWTFNPRSTAVGYTGTTYNYAGTAGCIGCTVTQRTIVSEPCKPFTVGVVPVYLFEGDDDEDSTHAVESPAIHPDNLFEFPSSFPFDAVFSAHWQAAVETTMTDPYWQEPYAPDCEIFEPDVLHWNEDDGNGNTDSEEVTEGGATIYTKFFPAHRLVEALATPPFGAPALPAGFSLAFDTSANDIPPPYYPNGIPIGDVDGNFGSVWRPYGFAIAACSTIGGSGRFAAVYSEFVTCP